ncbi:MAG: metal ABC transporter substrate-binding protein [Clostridiales bacterium]|nr:metal ABC transporter substrate-binding protein [Clostridiales bacterium]MDR2711650.1 metal ABC transporter substrate-binding protein [Clostridiales bacterium]
MSGKTLAFFAMAVVFGIFSLAAGGCEVNEPPEKDNGKINIVATIFPQYDFCRAIAGDRANLSLLIKPGVSVHSFEPSAADMKKIDDADVFIYIGGESDAWVGRLLSSLDTSNKHIISLIDQVDAVMEEIGEGMEDDPDDGEEEDIYDEHIWTSLQNSLKLIQVIADNLAEIDQENREFYQQNAAAYIDQIKELDQEIRDIVQNARRNTIVIADKFPFRYFVDEFGLDYYAAFPGCSDQADASASTIASLIKTVIEEQIPCIYYVELSNQNVARAVNEQTGAQMLLLNSCQTLSKEDFDAGATYLSLMRANAQALKEGLN